MWNIAKSAEEMFTKWAIKRVCRFMLKKKLGQFILGEIDIDQLDVQLRAGTIQLSDLALNIDYLNQKLGVLGPVMVKEGSIGSLLVTMPWKDKGCEVEIEEVELLLAPRLEITSPPRDENSIPTRSGDCSTSYESGKIEQETVKNATLPTSLDVHEGVKTVAKMVKWLLTSFHVKVKRLIIALDPCLEKDEKKIGLGSTLVLRISEIECGTCVSEDSDSNGDARDQNFLGISRLTNFVKFQGASLELLHMDAIDNQSCLSSDSGTLLGECFSGCCPSNATTQIMVGERGGFSGTLQVSMPWKNGTLDTRKVDADVYTQPVSLKIQPSTIKWFLNLWGILKTLDKNSLAHHKEANSLYYSASHSRLSSFGSVVSADQKTSSGMSLYSDVWSPTGQESVTNYLLPGSYFISDWVPFTTKKKQNLETADEPDFGASVDQFFECFDGMRSSQSIGGSSGMLNWTRSVFSAITAASNLASGSLHISSEQEHVETNLKATVVGISIVMSFHDEEHTNICDLKEDQINGKAASHYLIAECRDTLLSLQVCPQDMKFDVRVENIELVDHLNKGNGFGDLGLNSQAYLVQRLQSEVEDALPPLAASPRAYDLSKSRGSLATDFRGSMYPMDYSPNRVKLNSVETDDEYRVSLLRTSGACHCQITLGTSYMDGRFIGPTSFSLTLPPLIFWVNLHLINMLSDLLAEVGAEHSFPSEISEEKHGQTDKDVKRGSHHCVTTLSSKEKLKGNIFLLDARIILCFPFENNGYTGCYPLWDTFVALDFSSPTKIKEVGQSAAPTSDAKSKKRHSLMATYSLDLNVCNIDIRLVTSTDKDDVGGSSRNRQRQKFSAQNILSVVSRTGCLSVINMLWQEGSSTGPWIEKRAKVLATYGNSGNGNKFKGKGHEFVSVTTVEDLEDLNSRTQQEIIFSSTSFVHVHLAPVTINLGYSQYRELLSLLDQLLRGLVSKPVHDRDESSKLQTSILVECESVEILLRHDQMESNGGSMRDEPSGSWHNLKLNILKFKLLTVSNIGGIPNSNFLWVSHEEGKLWGCLTGVPDQEFLLISCSNSTRKRGDGEGSNALSSCLAGSDIIHMWEPESCHNFMSITIRCATVIAVGGRLDWFDAIASFFRSPSDIEQADEHDLRKDESNSKCGASFALNVVDIGLSYEPGVKRMAVSVEGTKYESMCSADVQEEMGDQFVACLLAASSLNLSNATVADNRDNDYKIIVQDLGLLLSAMPVPLNVDNPYSAEHLRKVGYVKVAGEALVEANLRTNCKNGLLWDLECPETHIQLDTCYDTTSGLIRLGSQLQQLFAPDVEESIVHLQTRWNNVQQAQDDGGFYNERNIFSDNVIPSVSQANTLSSETQGDLEVAGLMDEICEDAFQLDGNWVCHFDPPESQFRVPVDGDLLKEAKFFSQDLPHTGSVPVMGLEHNQTSVLHKDCFPEFIEDYCLSDTHPLSELSLGKQSCDPFNRCGSKKFGTKRTNGWYGDMAFNVVEDHIPEVSKEIGHLQFSECKLPSGRSLRIHDIRKAKARVHFKNVNVRWKMYAGSDWHCIRKDDQHSADVSKRDTTACIELTVSGTDVRYEMFPDGDVLVSKLSLSVQNFNLYDNSKDAPWKLVLGYYHSKDHPRESSSKALRLDLEAVKPDPTTPLEEYRLRIAFLPMLLHLHQSQLDFLITFFGGKSSSVYQSADSPQNFGGPDVSSAGSCNYGGQSIAAEALLPYFQKFDICPVLIRVDYTPRHVDLSALRGGKYTELLNLVPWKGIELQLKHVQDMGVYGWSSVCETIVGEWLEDISQNQIHKLLQGLPTIRSLVSVGSGAAKLVSLPVKNFKKDRRLLKGIQRGTVAFLRSISVEAVALGVHLAAGAHDILFQAEYILSNVPSAVSWPVQSTRMANIRSNQPKDAQQGIQQAYQSLSDGLGKSASALIGAPFKKFQNGASAGSALATAVCASPAAAIAPASAAVRAVHCALLGFRNSLDPEHKKESMEKYMGLPKPQEHL